MKFTLQLIFTILICALLQYFFSWWTLAIGAFLVAFLFDSKGFPSFLAGFIGVGLLWLSVSFYISWSTNEILTTKLNQLLPVNSLILTAVIGAVVGGFSSLTGGLFRKL